MVARDFVDRVIKLDVLRRDRLPTTAERIPWDWIRQADAAGLRTLAVGKAWRGAGADILSLCVAHVSRRLLPVSHRWRNAMTLNRTAQR